MTRTLTSDKGQTLPLFIVAATVLLFLAFALFAVGQAAVHRSGTQSGADAAVLAAAQEARDEIKDDLERAILTGDLAAVADLLATVAFESPEACAEAERFAAKNGADVTECDQVFGPPGYTVAVISQKPLGRTEVEGTQDKKAKARATAVIEARCSLKGGATEPEPGPDPDPSPSGSGGEDEGSPEPPALIEFDCDGDLLSLDPTDLDFDIAEFFSVHLRD